MGFFDKFKKKKPQEEDAAQEEQELTEGSGEMSEISDEAPAETAADVPENSIQGEAPENAPEDNSQQPVFSEPAAVTMEMTLQRPGNYPGWGFN